MKKINLEDITEKVFYDEFLESNGWEYLYRHGKEEHWEKNNEEIIITIDKTVKFPDKLYPNLKAYIQQRRNN